MARVHIFVVDDEPDILELVRYNLGQHGYDVTCVMSGKEILSLLRSHLPDLVVLDLMLPGMDGLEVCTEHPTAKWTAQQIVEAFSWDEASRYLLRDRNAIYGAQFQQRVGNMGIEEVKIAPRSPWQNPYVERLIGSIRRDCLNDAIVLNERRVKQI